MTHETEFVEHGYCLMWEPGLVWLHVLSDIITGLSYYAIAFALFYFSYKRRDLPFLKIFILFGVFILACGTTHLSAAYTIYVPEYWAEGAVKAITALVSLVAAFIFIPLMPRAIAMPSLNRAMKELQESEQKFRILFSANMDGLIMADVVTKKFVLVNKKICDMLGYEEAELTGLSLADIHPEQSMQEAKKSFEVRAKGEPGTVEIPCKRKDGTIFYAEIKTSVITSGAGTYLLGTFRDVTERKANAEALKKAEERSLRLMQSMVDGYALVDLSGKIIEHNEPYRAMLGYSDEELKTMVYSDLTPEKWHDFEQKIVAEQIMLRGYSDVYIKEYRRKDGTIFPVELRAFLVRDDQGKSIGMWGIVRDISERMKAEAAIMESEKRYHSLFQNMLNGMSYCRIILDDEAVPVDFEYIEVNEAFYRLTGQEYVIGKRVTELQPGIREANPEIFEIYGRVAMTGDPERFEVYGPTLGKWFSIAVYSPVKGYFVVIFDDITAKKQAEEERQKLEEQLRQSQKMEAIGLLAGGVAHDFNNIINAIMGYSTLIQMKTSPADAAREYANEILSATERAANLTRSLLAFGRKQVINVRPISLNSIVKDMGKLLLNFLGEDLKLQLNLSEEELVIMADSGQIDQVLMNLGTNARDAMPKGGRLTISTMLFEMGENFVASHGFGVPGKYAVLTVEDTGTGMSKATAERIFEPFYTTKEAGRGTGLGLAIVYGIVKQHNGIIDVYSEPGRGTCFKIYLPAVDFSAEQKAAVAQGSLVGGKEVLLLVEDESMLRLATKTILEKLGYSVLEAADGVEAVRVFREHMHEISLILMDVIMPNKGGKDAFDEIAAIKPDAKAIFMSGYTSDDTTRHIVESGLVLLLKPVSARELLDSIRKVLDAGKV